MKQESVKKDNPVVSEPVKETIHQTPVSEPEKTEDVGFDFSKKAEPAPTVETKSESVHKERDSGSCAQVAEDAKVAEDEKRKKGDFGDN